MDSDFLAWVNNENNEANNARYEYPNCNAKGWYCRVRRVKEFPELSVATHTYENRVQKRYDKGNGVLYEIQPVALPEGVKWQKTVFASNCVECGSSIGGWFIRGEKHHCRFCLFHVCNTCSTSTNNEDLQIHVNCSCVDPSTDNPDSDCNIKGCADGNGLIGHRACKRCFEVAKEDDLDLWKDYIAVARYGSSASPKSSTAN